MTHHRSPTPIQLPLPLAPAPLLTEPEYRSIVTALAEVLLTAAKSDPGGHSDDMALAFPPELLKRQAVIYVRQSTQSQVMTNLESQRRQYDLVEMARGYGFAEIDVIDDDLGVSASDCQTRPSFERLVALLCSGSIGAVFCLCLLYTHDAADDPP